MNKELLFQLYCIHSESGSEKKMRRFLRKVAKDCGAEEIVTDNFGNLLITKGKSNTYPCLAAHMDQVQHVHSKDFTVVEIGGDVIGYSPKCHEQQGLGADDKNGLFVCLELLRKFDVMKVAFFVGEETGCVGSGKVDPKFFKDCRFIVQPDRRGGDDLITSMFCGEVCSDDFVEAIGYKNYGYKFAHGSITDVGELVERGVGISCLNLSCGYYEAHTDQEITVLSELENCLNFVEHIVETCTDVYPFEGGYGGWAYGCGHYGHYSSGLYGGYGRFGGKSYDGAKEKSSVLPMVQPSPSSASDDCYNEDWDYYFDSGYYDEDIDLMTEYLKIQPDISFSTIFTNYVSDFNAAICFDRIGCENQLRDIYEFVKDDLYEHDSYWGEDDDTDFFGTTRKVS